jgi:hypothetical protein
MSYRTEFPSFPENGIPVEILHNEEWNDNSWHNDTCPSFVHVGGRAYLFVEYPNKADREYPESSRFTVYCLDDTGCLDEMGAFGTDDLSAALAFVSSL